jgi:hypothetical protein
MTVTDNSSDGVGCKDIWPDRRDFGLFLSHDIDQIHDREFFNLLAIVNHVRRICFEKEPGRLGLALQRLLRAIVCPKAAEKDFHTIREIEGRFGFRSTFYVLHDPYWRCYGPRYTLRSAALRRIIEVLRIEGCEIGLHGGYYRFNQADRYRESREALRDALGLEAAGIRNHYLRFSYPETWLAQEAAGFRYDATFGFTDQLGPRERRMMPFFPQDPVTGRQLDLVALPLTVMDVTLFRSLKLHGQAALDAAWQSIEPVIQAHGLVTLLWHNNYFNEPEYPDWQWVYEQLLYRLATLNPWCATGAEIAEWWRNKP